ncbi:GNAT family N-acetyltransferase [Winogradskyella immobilis]|uniref:GNAT family N-acetyltransferase n=1 Tax=Winogradskyella immobilis TaxID=2816852 RepID=A0ABS8EQ06_9FLAO|nr:GNAT family N-acetyltransferase [Winogradskyella immobilis]MCC1485190.1 GNAT family N-acetyltransferase [Winogradskyella immobilis]MCG0017282.1 GNAT family N-acetyltransferase [Winogradskyella immobilis]
MIAQFEGFEINSIHQGDAWKICNFAVSNADRLNPYFPITLEQNLNPTLSKLFVDKKVKAFINKEEFLFTLKHSETRELVGLIYIKELDWDKKQGEFAYCIGYPFEGKGLISKSIGHLSTYAFTTLGIETLQIITHKDNLGSVQVAKKNTFEWQKTLLKEYTPPGKDPLDMELYELYKKQ